MKAKRLLKALLLLALITFIAWLVWNKVRGVRKEDLAKAQARVGMGKLMVDAFIARPVPLENTLDASGNLLANESISLQPEINGRITHIYFQEGSFVSKGTLLVKLFDRDLQAQLEKLKAQLALEQLTLQREQRLLAINGISQQTVDNQKNLVDATQADIDNENAQISKTEIKAPFNGIVGLRNVSEGAIVGPGTIISTLDQIDPLKMDFTIPGKYADDISRGDEVLFHVSQLEGEQKGRIYAMEPQINQNTRTLRVRCLVSNKGGKLLPGSYTDVTVSLKKIPDALMIPTQAIIPTTRNQEIILYSAGRARFVTVQTGIRTQTDVQITQGLQPGDTVVITGIMQARPGIPLKITRYQE